MPRRFGLPSLALLLLLHTPGAPGADRPDVVVADFEGATYGGWVATGNAFGDGPARGTLPGQMDVGGFLGRGLVNSFRGGDLATGTLTSPPFTIERPYLNFLIGGGGYPGETCLNLLVGGSVVRTATGPNTAPGGSERLDWAGWDVTDLLGKTATLQVVDRRTGGWGHINVDQVVQSQRPRGLVPASRVIPVDARYLILPVRRDAPVRRVKVEAGGKTVREFDIRLADGPPDFEVSADLGPFLGASARVAAQLPHGSEALRPLRTAPLPPGTTDFDAGGRRPGFHFTSRRGWLNDSNGLVYFGGEYHLFYQHNPYGWDWGNMHWGHAVSPDLVHWSELGDALTPRAYGDWCFSGSAVVDHDNTSGFGRPGDPALVLAYTSTGRGECIAFSRDRGRTWTEYEGNPVVKHRGRDPRLVRHAKSGRWVMAVYDEEGDGKAIAFSTSPDLKTWTDRSRIDGFYECPDLFELPVDGDASRSLWVLSAADGAYLLGDFDGERFRPLPGTSKRRLWYGNFYAAQTFSDTPDGRRVQIGWAQGVTFPGLPFNQQMTVPCTLTLRTTPAGITLCAEPVAELARLRARSHSWRDPSWQGGPHRLKEVSGDLLAIEAEASLPTDGTLTLAVGGNPVVYDAAMETLTCGHVTAPLARGEGSVRLTVLADRGSIEVFGTGGRVALSVGLTPKPDAPPLTVSVSGARAAVRRLDEHELATAWKADR